VTTILTSTDYPAIRAVVGAKSPADLPDEVIAAAPYEPQAEAWARDLVSNWASIVAGGPSDDLTNLKAAVEYYSAYLLTSYLAFTTMDREEIKVGDALKSYQRNRSLDWDAQANLWLRQAITVLNRVTTINRRQLPGGNLLLGSHYYDRDIPLCKST